MIFKDKIHTFIAWVAVIMWMMLIFYLSHQPANDSSELSTGITDMIIGLIETTVLYMKLDFGNLHFFVRKSAHFFAYLILGMLVIHAMSRNRKQKFKIIIIALTICITYAISDEIHQLFITGRSGEVRDVIIDSTGSIVGVSFYLLVNKMLNKNRNAF